MVTAPFRGLPSTTSILAPSFLGAVPSVATTVAMQAPLEFCAVINKFSKICFIVEQSYECGVPYSTFQTAAPVVVTSL
jgi:hypothetical protein